MNILILNLGSSSIKYDLFQKDDVVIVRKSLGATTYYAALDNCAFVIGNSSSGVTEAPYFNKPVLNVGKRQQGRDKDVGVSDIEPSETQVKQALEEGLKNGWQRCVCSEIFGDGTSIKKIREIFIKHFG